MSGLALALARRIWFVPDVMIWGRPTIPDVDCLIAEKVGSAATVYFNRVATEDTAQRISFAQLVDHRGNILPDTIKAPRVLLRPKTAESVFLVGAESASDFAVARGGVGNSAVPVDLIVIEMGD